MAGPFAGRAAELRSSLRRSFRALLIVSIRKSTRNKRLSCHHGLVSVAIQKPGQIVGGPRAGVASGGPKVGVAIASKFDR